MTDFERVARFERVCLAYRRKAARTLRAAEHLAANGVPGAGQLVDQLQDLVSEPPALQGSLAATVRALRDLRLERTYLGQ